MGPRVYIPHLSVKALVVVLDDLAALTRETDAETTVLLKECSSGLKAISLQRHLARMTQRNRGWSFLRRHKRRRQVTTRP